MFRLYRFLLIVAVCSFGEHASAAEPRSYMGRQIAPTMSADGAEWLTRESRDREERPRLLLKALALKKGQQVCDFGCGNGYYSMELARRIGPRGTVFAVDIQQEMLDLLQARAEPRGLKNIRPILATAIDPNLPTGKLDLVLMVDVYHELSHPEDVLKAVHKSLSDKGRLVLVEYREEDPNVPIRPLHKMSQPQVLKEATTNGYKLVGQFDKLPWQHVLFFARNDASVPVAPLIPWRPKVSFRGDEPESPVAGPVSP
jgi:SAM-dependent methyltransferase